MQVRATAKHLPISPQKLRLVIDQVRGLYANEAAIILRHMPQKGARFAHKLLESAIANAEQNYELNRQDLYIQSVVANEGPRLKRYKAGARGRYKPRVKRTSHLLIVLEDRES